MHFSILWDNDGVLVDTEGLYFEACRTVLESVEVRLSLEQFKDISLRRGESVFVLAAEAGCGEDRLEELRTARNDLYGRLLRETSRVVDGAAEVLQALHGRARMGVVTSSRRDHFEIAHAASGLTRFMDFILTHEDYQRSKPDPEPYLTAVSRHGLDARRCVVVEDSERGLAAATAAGLPCLVVRSEWTRGGSFEGAHKVLDSIREVPAEVRKLTGGTWPCR